MRIHLQQYEDLLISGKEQKLTKIAAGYSGIAAFIAFAPAVATTAEKCPLLASPSDKAACGANVAAVVGAVAGLAGISLSAYALHLGNVNLRSFVKEKDKELKLRFEDAFPSDRKRADCLMSRYSSLQEDERKDVRNELFEAYLDNPRPVRAQPPSGQAALEIAL